MEKNKFLNFKKQIVHDRKYINHLIRYDESILEEAKYWIELKISRIEMRVGFFFGEKAAVFAMLAIAWACAKEFGGWPWLSKTIQAGFNLGNLGNTVLLYFLAFILGISLGGALLKRVAQHYIYQKEILLSCLRKQKPLI